MSARHPEVSRFLRLVPIFAGLSAELQARVAERVTLVEVEAGEHVFREGDPGDALLVALSGRLEVLTADGELIRILGRGTVLGELALLTASARSASVRARRDSTLLRLDRDSFDTLLRDEPEFAVALTRELGERLRSSRAITIHSDPRPSVVAILPLDAETDVRWLGTRLQEQLGRWSATARIDDSTPVEPDGPAALVDRAERDYDQVLLVSPHSDPRHPWTAFCLREADRLLAVAGPATPPAGEARLSGCDLVLEAGTTSPAAGWEAALAPRAVHRLRQAEGIECLARRLSGRSIGIVLSGGGARGLAHIGVLQELLEAGIAIDRVAGCSMGAFVGAMFAAGLAPDEVHARCRRELVERNPLNDYTLPMASLIRGRRVEDMLRRTFGERRIEDLEREYFCVSSDLVSSQLVVHRNGNVAQAVGSSLCLPGIGAPRPIGGRLLVDGGVLNNLPVQQMAERNEGPVIAVDVTARFVAPAAAGARFRRPGLRRLAAHVRGWASGVDEPVPSLKETLMRTITLGSIDTAEAAQRHADLVITPEVSEFGLLEFDRLDEIREAGRLAGRSILTEAAALQPPPTAAPAPSSGTWRPGS